MTVLCCVAIGAESMEQRNLVVTGKVLDRATRTPIDGAYVIAGYHEKIVDPAVVKQWCVRTKGMRTGPDGEFRFPVEKLDGMSPADISAIKPGYYLEFAESPESKRRSKNDDRAGEGWTIYLSRQDDKNPRYRYGSEDKFCYHAKTSADAAASVEFLKVQLAEYVRLGADQRQVSAVRDMIERLQGIDSAPPGALNPKVAR